MNEKKINEHFLEIDEVYFVTAGTVSWLVRVVNPECPEGYRNSEGDLCTAEIVQTEGAFLIFHDKPQVILYYTPGLYGRRFRKATQAEIIWFNIAKKDETVALKGYFSYLGWFLKNKNWNGKRI